jgi:exodeoxyribonuclease V gamma subunit
VGFIVHRSERADVLADALADELAVPLADPFRAEVVAVHAKGIERWLTNRLAARLGVSPGRGDGVCANISMPFPGRLVGDALARATGVDPASDPWRPERLVWPLLEVIDANLDQSWLEVLAGHLGHAGGGDASATDVANRTRRFAAARHLADLYDRYATHRPAMLSAWAAGRDDDGAGDAPGPLPVDARWQAELWRHLRDAIDATSPPERLAEGCAAMVADPGLLDLPERVFLFGLTRLPASYLDVLGAVAAGRDVHLFALHPSAALWSAVTADPDLGPDAAAELVRHPLLQAWGRDSREMQLVIAGRLAGRTDVVDRHHALDAAEPTTLLGHLQRANRDDLPLGGDGAGADRPVLRPDDRSVQVHRCHGRTRQAEVVRDAICHLLEDDPSLEPRDIVVLCPDIDELAPLLRAAFDAPAAARPVAAVDAEGDAAPAVDGLPVIPYRLADRSLRQTNPVLGAVAELLALADARLTSAEVLAFAALGPVRDRFRFDDDDLETIAGWVRGVGIRWGLDREHRAPYDLATVGTGTWQAGLRRILLGVAMAEEGQRVVGGVLPLDDVDSNAIDLAGRLAELVARLGDAVASLQGPQPLGAWVRNIDAAADARLRTPARGAWQRQQLDRLLARVADEAGSGGDPGAGGPALGLAEVRDLLADRLRGQPSRAAFRTGDLTMCTLVPMRSVPHRVVCLVGLDDGAFPRGGAPDGDDLLGRPDVRVPGDHDRRAEDRQLLLDAVLAATDALVVTYSGRDASTNEVRPPAVPVSELLDVLDRTAAVPPAPDGTRREVHDLVVHDHPLQPADRRYYEPDSLQLGRPWGFDPAALAGARALASTPAARARRFPGGRLDPVAEPVLALDDLVRFAEAPVRAFLGQRLGLSTGAWDDRPLDRLTVELDGLGEWAIADRVLPALLAGATPDAVAAAERARGLLPPGALGARSLSKALDKAASIAVAATEAADGTRSALDIDLDLGDGRRLVGSVPDVVGDRIRPTTASRLAAKHRVGAWVRFLAATAAHPDLACSLALVGWGGRGPATFSIAPLGRSVDERRRQAMDLLAVVVDLRDRGMREPLPIYAKTSHRFATQLRGGNADALDAAADEWTSSFARPREDREPAHELVYDGVRPWADVIAEEPAPDEEGEGWAEDQSSRFGRLALRLWDPILRAAEPNPTPASWQ